MTKQEAQATIISYIEDWANNLMADFVEDSINGSSDDEAREALELVGTNFNWYATINTDDNDN